MFHMRVSTPMNKLIQSIKHTSILDPCALVTMQVSYHTKKSMGGNLDAGH